MAAPWEQVAAEGTQPALLERVLARQLAPGGDPKTLARRAVELTVARGDVPLAEVVAAIAPPAHPTARDAAAAVARHWASLGVRAAVVGDAAYPRRLAHGWPLTGGPPLLAWRGPAAGLPDRPAVAIVGARRASAYGTGVAAWLAEAASKAGVLVVSGGAVGIDAAAHRAAVDGAGGTAVVLGCGHAVPYPRGHAAPGGLFEQVLAAGGWVLSELPPQMPPSPATVLARNRIVAGLADAVVVVEGSDRSGSLRTAAAAADRGVAVLAVPGDVRANGSKAPHRLLHEGAAPCTSPADLLEALGAATGSGDEPAADGDARSAPSALPPEVHAELARRWPRPVRVDDLAVAAGIPAGRLLAALTRARIAGQIAESTEGIRLTRAP